MLIDEPELLNSERLALAADQIERGCGEVVRVWLQRTFPHEHSYRRWLCAILRERGHSDEDAELLACGCVFHFEGDY